MTLPPDRLAAWRSRPDRKAIKQWENRTYFAARAELARRHPAEFLAILDEIREADPKPAAKETSDAA